MAKDNEGKTMKEGGDVIELIIGLDLDPKAPEPINVDVKGDEGAQSPEEGENWQGLLIQLLMGLQDAGVTSEDISYDEAKEAVTRALGEPGGEEEEPEEEEESKSPFDQARKGPKKPPKNNDGGMMGALERAIGSKKDDEEE